MEKMKNLDSSAISARTIYLELNRIVANLKLDDRIKIILTPENYKPNRGSVYEPMKFDLESSKELRHIRDTELYTCIGANVRNLRKQHGVTGCQLAALIGVTTQQLCKYEKGENRISIGCLMVIGEYFNKPLGWFMPEGDDVLFT